LAAPPAGELFVDALMIILSSHKAMEFSEAPMSERAIAQ